MTVVENKTRLICAQYLARFTAKAVWILDGYDVKQYGDKIEHANAMYDSVIGFLRPHITDMRKLNVHSITNYVRMYTTKIASLPIPIDTLLGKCQSLKNIEHDDVLKLFVSDVHASTRFYFVPSGETIFARCAFKN